MDERVLQLRIGVVVLVALLITLSLIIIFGGLEPLLGSHYTIYIRFREAPGVTVDTPVRKSGVLIGRVTGVQLLDDGNVLISAAIEEKYRLRHSEVCRIDSGSLLGDAVLEFVPSDNTRLIAVFDNNGNGYLDEAEQAESHRPILNEDFISDGLVASNPLEVLVNLEDDLRAAMSSVDQAGTEVRHLARNLNSAIGNNETQVRRLMQKTEGALDEFQTAMRTIKDVVGDEELAGELKTALKEVPGLVADAKKTMEDARTSLASFRTMSESAEENLENLKGITEPLRDNGDELLAQFLDSLESMDEIMTNVLKFSRTINESDGTLGKLIHDPELYNQLTRTARNVEAVSLKLRPVVDNVRVFTDKIARDPRQLGVRGALDKKPTGLKPIRWEDFRVRRSDERPANYLER